jgi:CHAT domain-containing protein/tetratricopeptide (TPR) repeat protein
MVRIRVLPLLAALSFGPQGASGQQPNATAAGVADLQRAVAAAVAEHGSDSLPAAQARLALAREWFRRGDAAAAERAVGDCTAGLERRFAEPGSALVLADALLVLGACRGMQDDLDGAAAHYRRALALRERSGPPGSAEVQLLRFNLAAVLVALFDWTGALELARAGHAQATATRGADSLAAGSFVSLLALAGDGLGHHWQASEHYEEAEHLLRRHRGDEYPDALRMAVLGGVASARIGRHAEALPKVAAALAAMRRIPGFRRDYVVEAETCYAVLQAMFVRDESAVQGLRDVLARAAEGAAPGPADAARLLMVMSMLRSVDPDLVDIDLARQALARCEEGLGGDHVFVAALLGDLADLHRARGDHAAAAAASSRAAAIFAAAPWFVGTDRWKVLQAAAADQARIGQYDAALQWVERSLAEVPTLLEAWASPLDERQRLELAAALRHGVDLALTLGALVEAPAAARWQNVLAWKGLVSRGLLQSLQWLQRHHDPEVRQLVDRLRQAVARWSAAVRAGAAAEVTAAAAHERAEVAREFDRRRAALPSRAPRPDDVAAALADDEVLLDFVVHSDVDPAAGRPGVVRERLLVFVVRRGGEPTLLDLGPVAPIRAAIAGWLQAASRWTRPIAGAEAVVEAAGRAVTARLWQPVLALVPAGARVLVCPDSVVALVPFGALPGAAAGSFLVEAHEFVVLAGAGDLLQPAAAAPAAPCLAAIGDVDYGGRPDAVAARAGWREFAHLPAAGAELDAVVAAFRAAGPDHEVRVLRGREPDAVRTAAAVVGATHVHIATHGWYSGSLALPDAARRRVGFEAPDQALPADAGGHGAQGGIALAGANLPPRDGDDGVLTADEITLLDLGSCRLAVLSACEAALGTISAADGLLGLRRSLRLAGARATLSPVWRVEDDATRRCMVVFYDALWRAGRSPGAALRAAQLAMLRDARSAGGQALVGRWGAFVLEGR